MPRKREYGICRLTGLQGKFVKAHLLPKALTRPGVAGTPFVETSSHGDRPKRSWSSWYDTELVTADGEAILADFDNEAISELRKQKLVWSGFGPLQKLPHGPDHDAIGETGLGLRKLRGTDFRALRLFFLSLLWRAAASRHEAFGGVALAADELADLGSRLVARDPGSPTYFAVHLIQLSTLGAVQNLSPFGKFMRIPELGDVKAHSIPIFRIYLDGLIAHIHPNRDTAYDGRKMGTLVLGQCDFTAVLTIEYEISFQHEDMLTRLAEAWIIWPNLMEKL
ncbi:hypothetical protein ACVMIH_007448 [Bradyrhizobium sp. USDA 4503]